MKNSALSAFILVKIAGNFHVHTTLLEDNEDMESCKRQNHFPVVTLCGSARFKEEFSEVQKRLTIAGNIVISVVFFDHGDVSDAWDDHTKQMLDQIHLQKIDMSDEIYVIDVGGYVGESTRREISYAGSKGKRVTYYSSDKGRLMK